jgi:hypothetical protein
MMKLLIRPFFLASQVQQAYKYPIYNYAKDIPATEQRTHRNLFMAVNSALDIAL